ncbi:MAG: MucR family transcriptional regulator [Rhodobacteraceae bacterium]|nr:MucR family transcriptional regulator [Paracoccaceae bacterium]
MKPQEIGTSQLLKMTSDIVAAHVGNNTTDPQDISSLLSTVHAKLSDLSGIKPVFPGASKPAVPIDESITPDHLVCLEDGRKMKMLKRHLNTVFGLSPDQYRTKWGLPSDYPMVAPNYALRRQELAKQIGLGRRPKA